MKWNKSLIWSIGLLVLVAALYRIIPGRPPGFAPQLAMAVFAGAIIKNKKWAFLMPILSMFISDLCYQLLFLGGISSRPGFYEGQWQNYLLFGLMVVIGFAIKKPLCSMCWYVRLWLPRSILFCPTWSCGLDGRVPGDLDVQRPGMVCCCALMTPCLSISTVCTLRWFLVSCSLDLITCFEKIAHKPWLHYSSTAHKRYRCKPSTFLPAALLLAWSKTCGCRPNSWFAFQKLHPAPDVCRPLRRWPVHRSGC